MLPVACEWSSPLTPSRSPLAKGLALWLGQRWKNDTGVDGLQVDELLQPAEEALGVCPKGVLLGITKAQRC